MILDSESLVEIKAISSKNKILGKSVVKVEKGMVVFDKISFYGAPGSTDNIFSISTKAIRPSIIKKYYGEEFYESVIH